MARARLGIFVLLAAAAPAACSSRPPSAEVATDIFPPQQTPASRPPSGPLPSYGPTQHLAEAPPPISGGTLLVTRAGYAVASDPERDRIFVVNPATTQVHGIEVARHAEPGRAVDDDSGKVHVVLRNTGELLTIDPASGLVVARRPVCKAPRGIALAAKATGNSLLVACAGGDLVEISAAPDGAAQVLGYVADDLRDVVVSRGKVYVTTFRSAQMMEVALDGSVVKRVPLLSRAEAQLTGLELRTPRVAWRMIPSVDAGGNGMPIVVHQLASNETVATGEPGAGPRPPTAVSSGYGSGAPGSGCGVGADAVVVTSITRPELDSSTPVNRDRGALRLTNGFAVLPVDVASDGTSVTIVAAGNGHTPERPQLFTMPIARGHLPFEKPSDPRFAKDPALTNCAVDVSGSSAEVGQLVAVAYRSPGKMLLQSREPAQLVLWPERIVIPLSTDSREDTGHAIFHSNSSVGISCASCHAEGGDDGHTWHFDVFGTRRTPSLLGTLEGTAPYHWSGDMDGLDMLADKVFTSRMRGPLLDGPQKAVLRDWLFALPAPGVRVEKATASVVRGRALFESPSVGCASCHGGPRFTTSASVDVGTGGVFQVPSLLGVSARAPFLHDGCATTLRERFDARCTTDQHGKTSHLTASDIDDLVGYLESL